MAEDDDFRVEARLTNARGGLSSSQESIDLLRQRQEAHAKATRKKPAKPFAQVLAADAGAPPAEPAPQERPPTPRPGLRRPSEKDAYGVVRKTRVILKG